MGVGRGLGRKGQVDGKNGGFFSYRLFEKERQFITKLPSTIKHRILRYRDKLAFFQGSFCFKVASFQKAKLVFQMVNGITMGVGTKLGCCCCWLHRAV